VQRGQLLLCDFLDLRRSIVDEGDQLRELFLLMGTRRGSKSIEVIQKVLHLIREWVGLPFEWRPRIPQPFPFTNEFLCNSVDFFLQLIGALTISSGIFVVLGFPASFFHCSRAAFKAVWMPSMVLRSLSVVLAM